MNFGANRLFEHFFESVIVPYLEPRMKTGAIKATKAYIEGVRVARKLVIQGFVIGLMSSIMVTGALMVLFGALALMPLLPQVLPIIAIVLGALFFGVTAYLFNAFFKEEGWLKVSKSHELMEAVLADWEDDLKPPNPLEILRKPSNARTAHQKTEHPRDISTAVIAADKSHIPYADVAAGNVGGSAAMFAPEAPLIIPPAQPPRA